jgi:predicted N-acyltransferase
MRDIARADWDQLVGSDMPPFLSHAFLDALEQAGCVTPQRGWLPMHLTLWEDERLLVACPAYVKGNSEGEFVFDYGWADLPSDSTSAITRSPSCRSSRRDRTSVLVRREADAERMASAAAEGIRRLVMQQDLWVSTSCFATCRPGTDRAFVQRWGVQYQWRNQGYGSVGRFFFDIFDAAARPRGGVGAAGARNT